jgi:hypothetical protein
LLLLSCIAVQLSNKLLLSLYNSSNGKHRTTKLRQQAGKQHMPLTWPATMHVTPTYVIPLFHSSTHTLRHIEACLYFDDSPAFPSLPVCPELPLLPLLLLPSVPLSFLLTVEDTEGSSAVVVMEKADLRAAAAE